jgi:hypothetical protein
VPRATAITTEGDKVDLKTLEGGYVQLRKLTYGEMLKRRDMAVRASSGRGRDVNIDFQQLEVAVYEFSHAVVDHNLEDEDGNKLDLSKRSIVESLDPIVAQEIEQLIDDMNQLPDGRSKRGDGGEGTVGEGSS